MGLGRAVANGHRRAVVAVDWDKPQDLTAMAKQYSRVLSTKVRERRTGRVTVSDPP